MAACTHTTGVRFLPGTGRLAALWRNSTLVHTAAVFSANTTGAVKFQEQANLAVEYDRLHQEQRSEFQLPSAEFPWVLYTMFYTSGLQVSMRMLDHLLQNGTRVYISICSSQLFPSFLLIFLMH